MVNGYLSHLRRFRKFLSVDTQDDDKVRFPYAQEERWGIGITETQTSLGNIVRLYDKERCICDLIRQKAAQDKQLYVQAIREYFKGAYNARKLIRYGKVFGIEDKVRDYMEILVGIHSEYTERVVRQF